ncbi:MAG: class I SAM-dependent methyltransferase [Hydrotalea sp.]|nr:class I SAM-dependent methyltransferase [Hydrotalea sp.]
MNLPSSAPPLADQQLKNYYHLLVAWNDKLNLIAPQQIASFDYFRQHHLAPCLWLAEVIGRDLGLPSTSEAIGQTILPSTSEAIGQTILPSNSEAVGQNNRPQVASAVGQNNRFIDLGSGNGLPAIPLAIHWGFYLAAGDKPITPSFIMVEKTNKKAAALQAMVGDLRLNAAVVARTMVEVLPDLIDQQRPGFITARALLPLPKLLPLLSPLVPKHLPLYLLKGAKINDEWRDVKNSEKQKWRMDILATNHAGGVVARLEKK